MTTDKDYHQWMAERSRTQRGASIDKGYRLSKLLFEYQRDIVAWALARGRACIFADTGLGKTFMQIEWARVVSRKAGRVLILAPLAVTDQTVREAKKFKETVRYLREDDGKDGIIITNYEMLDRFDPSTFAGVVLDESSILKSFTGKMRNAIIESFRGTDFRLACTATPAPNDHMELGNHSEFIGVKSRVEMLSEFFVHDGGSTSDWRLKGHAKDAFWRWVASWAAMVRMPSDLGYSNDGFELPPLTEETLQIDVEAGASFELGTLFFEAASMTLTEQRAARRSTTTARVRAIADAIAAEPDEPALVWCEYNDESEQLTRAIKGAVEVKGADAPQTKTDRLLGFADGRYHVLVTKPKIAGFGMNWQHCARVYFAGPSHSFEQTYQAIRRCWRFGQTRPVIVRTCVSTAEISVVENLKRKQQDAEEMARRMVAAVSSTSYVRGAGSQRQWDDYNPNTGMEVPSWLR